MCPISFTDIVNWSLTIDIVWTQCEIYRKRKCVWSHGEKDNMDQW